jgi:hypothetical protein
MEGAEAMTEQFKALRLADALDRNGYDAEMASNMNQAAAELRRLYAENERLHQINQWHEMKLSVRGYVIQVDDLKAANAELLAALKRMVLDGNCRDANYRALANDQARAAIARAEQQPRRAALNVVHQALQDEAEEVKP